MGNYPEKGDSPSTGTKEALPACFGDLDHVFPMHADGLRRSPESCLACAHKTNCLASAAARRRETLGRERLDRDTEAGRVGFLARWSRKKHLSRLASRRNRG